jgi:hypothetical protein
MSATKEKMARIPYSGIDFVFFLSSSAFYSTLVLHSESIENKINQSCHSVEILNMYILLITTVFDLPLLSYVRRRRFVRREKRENVEINVLNLKIGGDPATN